MPYSMSNGLKEGLRQGTRQGLGREIFADTSVNPLASVSRDATSLIYVPNTAAEWTTFLSAIGSSMAAPDHLWRLQEASGNPADSIGSKTLTATGGGNAPTYQKTITGWTRKAIGGPATGAIASNMSNTAMVNTATTSFLVLGIIRSTMATTAVRSIISYGVNPLVQQLMSNKVRARLGASIVDSTNSHADVVRPYAFIYDVTNSACKLYTDLEKITLTYSVTSGSTLTLTCAIAGDNKPSDFLYLTAWDGADAEVSDAQVKALLQGLGYTIPWS